MAQRLSEYLNPSEDAKAMRWEDCNPKGKIYQLNIHTKGKVADRLTAHPWCVTLDDLTVEMVRESTEHPLLVEIRSGEYISIDRIATNRFGTEYFAVRFLISKISDFPTFHGIGLLVRLEDDTIYKGNAGTPTLFVDYKIPNAIIYDDRDISQEAPLHMLESIALRLGDRIDGWVSSYRLPGERGSLLSSIGEARYIWKNTSGLDVTLIDISVSTWVNNRIDTLAVVVKLDAENPYLGVKSSNGIYIGGMVGESGMTWQKVMAFILSQMTYFWVDLDTEVYYFRAPGEKSEQEIRQWWDDDVSENPINIRKQSMRRFWQMVIKTQFRELVVARVSRWTLEELIGAERLGKKLEDLQIELTEQKKIPNTNLRDWYKLLIFQSKLDELRAVPQVPPKALPTD